ncbi:MAG: hypothetical protein NUV48_07215 [Peptococcaceae bacterium]|jgi:hypothetical protein|nr:hypothetical protein [Peptococcaceae bacterium]
MAGGIDFTALLAEPSTLGALVWFNADEHKRYHREDIRRALEKHGFSVDLYLPPPPSRVDIFKTACSSVERKKQKDGGEDGVYVDILVSGTRNDAKVCVRHITRRERDAKNVELRHPEIARAVYDKDYGKLTFEGENESLSGICETIRRNFLEWQDTYSVGVVRDMFRTIAKNECHGQKFRKNGGFFVPLGKMEVCARLEGLMRDLGCEPDVLEVASKPKARASLREKMAAALMEEADALVAALGDAKNVAEVMALSSRVNALRESARINGEALLTEFTEVLVRVEKVGQLVKKKLAA